MDAVTYPDDNVIAYVRQNYIGLRIGSDTEPYCVDFMVKWTPRIIVLDSYGLVHQSTVGFFPPEEFVPSLELGLAKSAFNQDRLKECKKHLEKILAEHPNSGSAPEAVFFQGVTAYKLTDKAGPLKDAYNTLQEKYPESGWVKRALPYRLL